MQGLLLCVVFCAALGFAQGYTDVHIIAHTHDDVGWLKTVDEYYYGANNSIQEAGVQYILDTVIQQLQLNPERKFIYVEIAFFMRWWREQTLELQQIVKNLVREGRFEFINGGWTMNDEACTSTDDNIAQMTEGHEFIFRNFGTRPTIGWQIDPFGHSSATATLFAKMGFNAFFFARSDYQDYERRKNTSELEFIWRSSESLGASTDIFTHILYDSTYCEADGFSFQDDDVQPVMSDRRLEGYNIDKIAKHFYDIIVDRSKHFKTDNIFFTFGCDFQYMDAVINFKNMDLLIKYINERKDTYGLNVFYSTPSLYLKAVHDASTKSGMKWPLNTFDFFPYRDDPYSVWAGYFTSRSAIKGYVRSRANLRYSTELLFTAASGVLDNILTPRNYERQDNIVQATAVTTHHDAVTGTEKQHVADDYAKQLSVGSEDAHELIAEIAQKLTDKKKGQVAHFTFCELLNVSICPATDILSNKASVLPILVYNPLSWSRSSYFRIPIPVKNVQVVDEGGNVIASQVNPNADVAGTYTLIFEAELRPLSYKSFVLQQSTFEPVDISISHMKRSVGDITIQNDYVSATISSLTGHVSYLQNKVSKISLFMNQELMWWNASAGNNINSSQPSGAYIFRPNGTEAFNISTNNIATVSSFLGPVVQEIRQTWANWATQTVRLYNSARYLEIESTIGPIPIQDNLGKEIISRYSTGLNSGGLWYSDSNNLEFQQRKRNFRPTYKLNVTEPVALNYVPADTAGYIEDTSTKQRLTVIHDRAGGVGSLNDGQIEFMIHRRLLYDDYRGVGEPLNESNIVRTTQYAYVDTTTYAARAQRRLSLELSYPSSIIFTTKFVGTAQSWFSNFNTNFAGITKDLPFNIHLQTLRTIDTGETILRLQHIFATGEDPVYSKRTSVDLSGLFKNLFIVDIAEYSLTANTPIRDVHRYDWKTSTFPSDKGSDNNPFGYSKVDASNLVVELEPMDIRTFIVRFQPAV